MWQNLLKGSEEFAGECSKLCCGAWHTLLIRLGSSKKVLREEGGNKKVLTLEGTSVLPSRCNSRARHCHHQRRGTSPTLDKPQGRARGAADGPQPYQTRPEPRQRACSSGQGL